MASPKDRKSPLLKLTVLTVASLVLLIIFSPLIHTSPALLGTVLREPRVRSALFLSLLSSTVSASLAVAVALPVSYYVSRRSDIVSRLSGSLFLLLLGFPPVGIGISLLILLRDYPGFNLAADTLGLLFSRKSIVLAQFTVATPIAVGILSNTLSYLPPYIEELAEVYGIPPLTKFRRLILPVSLPGIVGAWAVVWFRCFGEFGATLVLAGNIPNYTETVPLAVYNMLSLVKVEAASALLILSAVIGLVTVTMYSITSSKMLARIKLLLGEANL